MTNEITVGFSRGAASLARGLQLPIGAVTDLRRPPRKARGLFQGIRCTDSGRNRSPRTDPRRARRGYPRLVASAVWPRARTAAAVFYLAHQRQQGPDLAAAVDTDTSDLPRTCSHPIGVNDSGTADHGYHRHG